MNKVLDEFTGIIGVGCLVSLGLFFLTNSQYDYWHTIEHLMETNSWGILVSIPILIVNYILGLITIELGEIIMPMVIKNKNIKDFQDNFGKIAKINNEFITARYNEVYQNKRILNGSSIGFILVSVGVFLEGIDLWRDYRIIGIIGMVGSLIITCICSLISIRIQYKFNKSISDFDN